jgi:tetratricopeptide (TPR) repeat protein
MLMLILIVLWFLQKEINMLSHLSQKNLLSSSLLVLSLFLLSPEGKAMKEDLSENVTVNPLHKKRGTMIPLTFKRGTAQDYKKTIETAEIIKVTTDNNARATYQALTNRVKVNPGEVYEIPYSIDVKSGKMAFGVLNSAWDGWIGGEEIFLNPGLYAGVKKVVIPENETEISLVLRNYHLKTNGGPGQTKFTAKVGVGKEEIQKSTSDKIFKAIPFEFKKGTAQKYKKTIETAETLEIITDNNTNATYQAITQKIKVNSGEVYEIPYNIDVKNGKMAFGVLNTKGDGWIGGEKIFLNPGSYAGAKKVVIPTGETDICLILRNYHLGIPGQSIFTAKLELEKKPLPNIFQILPPGMLRYVFSFLPVEDLLTLACVSQKMNTLSKADSCWNGRFINGIKIKNKEEFKEEFLNPTLFTIKNKDIYDIKTSIEIVYQTEESPFNIPIGNKKFYCQKLSIPLELKSGEEIKICSNVLPVERSYKDFLGIKKGDSTNGITCYMTKSEYPIVGAVWENVYLLNKHTETERKKLIIYPYGESNLRQLCVDRRIYNDIKRLEEGKKSYILGLNYKKVGNTGEALKSFTQASKTGVTKAFYELGLMYEKGNGVQKNIPQAIKYYEEATHTNNDQERGDAFVSLGMLYWKGAEDLKQDFDKALQYFKSAGVHKEALYNMGCMYLEGEGIQQSSKIAINFFERAFSLGSLEAYTKLGYIYLKGIGIPKDLEKANHYLSIANTFKDGDGDIEIQNLLQAIQEELKN